jgi:hypothetical protein
VAQASESRESIAPSSAQFVRSTLECGGNAAALEGRWNREDPQRVMLAQPSR